MIKPSHIVITGASSGLGAALARYYAKPGVRLALLGRHEERIKETAKSCEQFGATVQAILVDVTDKESMTDCLTALDSFTPIDLIIANAGISGGMGGEGESEAQVRAIFSVNVDGVMNTLQPVIPRMVARKKGQIAIMSSLAGIRGLPSAPAYSASKAAVRFYGEGLRGYLGKAGVDVSVICPGYIKTPLTDKNTFPMPFIMDADIAAARIAKGLARNQSRIAFPRRLYWPLWWLSCLSPAITDPFFAALPAKPSIQE